MPNTTDVIVIKEFRPETRELVINVNVDGRDYPTVVPFLSRNDAASLRAQLRKLAKDLREDLTALKTAIELDNTNDPAEVTPEVEALVGQEISLDEETPEVPTDGTTPTEEASVEGGENQPA